MALRIIAWSVTAVILSSIAGGGIIHWRAQTALENAERAWSDFAGDASHKTHILNQLRQELGFVGFISDVKKFVLRNDPAHAEAARRHGARALNLLDEYTAYALSDDEQAAVRNLRGTVRTHLEILQATQNMMALGRTGSQVDAEIRIDDTAAAAALEVLDEAWLKAHGDALAAMKTTLDDSRQQLHAQVYALPLAVGGALLILWLVARLVREAERRARAMDELQRAKEIADAANEAKSLFLANVSHELRTPLNGVLGFTEMMRSEAFGPIDNPKYKEYLGDIHTGASHLLKLIDDILDTTRAEQGILRLAEDNLDMETLIANTTRMIPAELGRIDVSIPRPLPLFLGDSLRLRQALLNLLANALKFSPPDGLVFLRAVAGDDDAIAITVEDQGIGMTEREIEIVMEPFAQLESGYTRTYDGLGLGLPLARRLVETHGGALDLKSAPGKGTIATIHLPASRSLPRI